MTIYKPVKSFYLYITKKNRIDSFLYNLPCSYLFSVLAHKLNGEPLRFFLCRYLRPFDTLCPPIYGLPRCRSPPCSIRLPRFPKNNRMEIKNENDKSAQFLLLVRPRRVCRGFRPSGGGTDERQAGRKDTRPAHEAQQVFLFT